MRSCDVMIQYSCSTHDRDISLSALQPMSSSVGGTALVCIMTNVAAAIAQGTERHRVARSGKLYSTQTICTVWLQIFDHPKIALRWLRLSLHTDVAWCQVEPPFVPVGGRCSDLRSHRNAQENKGGHNCHSLVGGTTSCCSLRCQLSMPYAAAAMSIDNRTNFPFPELKFDAQGHTLSFFALSSFTPLRVTCTTQESKFSNWLINGFIAPCCPPVPFRSPAIELCD